MAGSKNFTRAGEQAFQKMDKINAEVFTLTYGSMVQQLLKVGLFFCRLCLPRCRVICSGARTHACTMDTCVDTHETLSRTCTRGDVVCSHVRYMYMSNVLYLCVYICRPLLSMYPSIYLRLDALVWCT